MIPHKLHYVWVGGAPIPDKYQAFINHWSEVMPNWEIVRWDESNFDIANSSDFCRQAYQQKRWAFVSDYIRVKVLYEHGGIYLDTDEQMVQSLERFADHKFFVGMEPGDRLGAQVFGCESQNLTMGAILNHYDSTNYIEDGKQNNEVIGSHFATVLKRLYPQFDIKEEIQELGDGVVVYPSTYFCPDLATLTSTDESYTIHRPMGSWLSPTAKLKKYIYTIIIQVKPLNWLYRKIKR